MTTTGYWNGSTTPPSTEATREPEIQVEFAQMEVGIDELMKVFDLLVSRLAPVIGQDTNAKDLLDAIPSTTRTGFGQRLNACRTRIEKITRRIYGLTHDLEI